MRAPSCWVLNLDAEDELAAPDPRRFQRAQAMIARIQALRPRLLGLVPQDAEILDPPGLGAAMRGQVPRCFCPTPSALRALTARGLHVRAPSLELLRRVNHRRFVAELGQTLPRALFAADRAALDRALDAAPPGEPWLLKRPFGFAGRGRRRVRAGQLDAGERAWIEASFASGDGVQAEPWQTVTQDFALHGYLLPDGALHAGVLTTQVLTAEGAWVESIPAPEGSLSSAERADLHVHFARVVEALRALGYFGPFNVDAYRYEGGFQPLSELNARYSMGYSAGMGPFSPPEGLP